MKKNMKDKNCNTLKTVCNGKQNCQGFGAICEVEESQNPCEAKNNHERVRTYYYIEYFFFSL